MAKIVLRGHQNAITVERDVAERFMKAKQDKAILDNQPLMIGEMLVTKGDIKSIILNDAEDTKSEKNDEKMAENARHREEVEQEHVRYIKTRCAMAVGQKSSDTNLAQLAWTAYTGDKKAPQEFLQGVIELQTKYYTNNPRHPFARVNFSHLLPKLIGNSHDMHISSVMPGVIANLIVDIISQGFSTAKKYSFI